MSYLQGLVIFPTFFILSLNLAIRSSWSEPQSTSPDGQHRNQIDYIPMYAATAKSLQSCPTLCDPTDGSPLGSTVPGILQARTLEWVAISFSNAWQWKVKVKSLSKCRTLRDPLDYSLPDSSIHIDISPGNLDSSLCFFQPSTSHDVLCIEVK